MANNIDKTIDELKSLWKANPHLRLAQLVHMGQEAYYLEDARFIAEIKVNLKEDSHPK